MSSVTNSTSKPLISGISMTAKFGATRDVDTKCGIVASHRAGLADLDSLAGRNHCDVPFRLGQSTFDLLDAPRQKSTWCRSRHRRQKPALP